MPTQDSSVGDIITVAEDRLRLPFKGGALKVPLGESYFNDSWESESKLDTREDSAFPTFALPAVHLFPPPPSSTPLLPFSPPYLLRCPPDSLQAQTSDSILSVLVILQRRSVYLHQKLVSIFLLRLLDISV